MKYFYQPITEGKHSVSPLYTVATIRHNTEFVELVQNLGTDKNKEKRRKGKKRGRRVEGRRGREGRGACARTGDKKIFFPSRLLPVYQCHKFTSITCILPL